MRLTLRTMLAFLDDVLEGPDARELEQKIDESKFASDLVHRIRGSVRRLRLGAPKLNGKGMGADANTVAEYLDNTMPPERVPDFEKVCLESDVQLAEVAACHQVLTIVLGEPAAVDPSMRDRMYRIGHGSSVTSPGTTGSGTGHADIAVSRSSGAHDGNGISSPPRTSAAEPATKAAHTAVEIQRTQQARPKRSAKPAKAAGEARESAFPLKSLAVTLLLFFIVTGVALRAIAPIDSKHPLWVLFSGGDQTAQVTPPGDTDRGGPKEPPQPVVEVDTAGPSASSKDSTVSQQDTNARENDTGSKVDEASASQPVPPPASGDSSVAPPPVPPAVATVESPMPGPTAPSADPATTTVPAPTAVAPGTGTPTTSVPGPGAEASATGKAVPLPPPVQPIPSIRPPGVASAPINVGRYISEGQILARMDTEKNAWMVLPPDSPLNAGERLLSLPTYRPQIVVAPSVKLTVAGEAFLKLQPPDAGDLPRLSVDFGRILLVPVGEMGTSVQLDLGGRMGQLAFNDVESMAAIEVRPYLPVGADPMTVVPNLLVQIWAISGGTRWVETDRPPVPLTAGQSLQLIDEEVGTVLDAGSAPEWVDGEKLQDLDRRASQELRRFLTTDRPLALSLFEQTNYRQVEVRALSCRCLCYLDIFEPAIAKLGDVENHSTWMWNPLITAIQSTLPFGPETVTKLQADIEKLHGKDSERVFRLLLGYSPEQLAAGGAAELVESLASESMAIRVLAFMTLKGITGKTLLYRPEERPEQEKSKIAQWQKLLQDGLIVYKNPPTPFPTAPATVPPPPPGTPTK